MITRPLVQDAFKPILFNSPPLAVTEEQLKYIKEVIRIASSDSRFKEKAIDAIEYILTAGNTPPPVVTSLTPSNATLGSPSFTLSVKGTDLVEGSKIIWNGSEEPTTFKSNTELTTGVDMSTAEVAMDIPVSVQAPNGVLSNSMIFTLNPLARNVVKDPTFKPVVPPIPPKSPVKPSVKGEA